MSQEWVNPRVARALRHSNVQLKCEIDHLEGESAAIRAERDQLLDTNYALRFQLFNKLRRIDLMNLHITEMEEQQLLASLNQMNEIQNKLETPFKTTKRRLMT